MKLEIVYILGEATMKKFLMCLVTLNIIFAGLYASGGSDTTAKKNGLITVGYVQGGAKSDWRTANTESFKTIFTEKNGYQLLFEDAQQEQENQIKAIRNFIQQDVNYIVIAPIVETGWDSVLGEAKKAGIPIILSDRMIKLADQGLYTAWVGGNFLKEGQDAVKWLNSYVKKNSLQNKDLNVIILQGTIGSSAQVGRTQGVTEGLAKNPRYKLLAKQTGEFSQSKGQEVMESFLKVYQKIDVVIAENDNMAFGAIDAIYASGKKPGKDIVIISFDAVRESFNRMIAGEINCDIEYNPLHGPRIAEIIQLLESGKAVEKIMYVHEEVFDSDNARAKFPSRKY